MRSGSATGAESPRRPGRLSLRQAGCCQGTAAAGTAAAPGTLSGAFPFFPTSRPLSNDGTSLHGQLKKKENEIQVN